MLGSRNSKHRSQAVTNQIIVRIEEKGKDFVMQSVVVVCMDIQLRDGVHAAVVVLGETGTERAADEGK